MHAAATMLPILETTKDDGKNNRCTQIIELYKKRHRCNRITHG